MLFDTGSSYLSLVSATTYYYLISGFEVIGSSFNSQVFHLSRLTVSFFFQDFEDFFSYGELFPDFYFNLYQLTLR